jgi:hypothetical protein
MLLCLDSEKQQKGANVNRLYKPRLVQWLFVYGRSVALLMRCICMFLCHTMQRHWYVEGAVGTAETTRWLLTPLSFARTHGMTDESET